MMPEKFDLIIIGGGPCGLATAIAAQQAGLKAVIIEKGNVVNTIYRYPIHQVFFSTSEKLEIGDVPFAIPERKPRRNQALAYYREVTRRKHLIIKTFECVTDVHHSNEEIGFTVRAVPTYGDEGSAIYQSKYVVIATGYFDLPNQMGIPGEELSKVSHYFEEAHPFFQKNVLVVGGKNSAVDATLELVQAGANVTVIYRGDVIAEPVKPWILPEFESLQRHGLIDIHYKSKLIRIESKMVTIQKEQETFHIPNDFVLAMTGYQPDHKWLHRLGIRTDPVTGRPLHDSSTMESEIKGMYLAGVIAAGNDANEIFIENGRFHGSKIVEHILASEKDRSETDR